MREAQTDPQVRPETKLIISILETDCVLTEILPEAEDIDEREAYNTI
jgi:hypothetical protein